MSKKKSNRLVNYTNFVIYANKLNQVPLANFNRLEQNLLFSIFKDIKNDDKCLGFKWDAKELKTMASLTEDEAKYMRDWQLKEVCISLEKKFFNCAWKIILPMRTRYTHLFTNMDIRYADKEQTIIESLSVELNPSAIDIFRNLKNNFTSFELFQFKALKSSYSKSLFRFLSQYASTGIYSVDYKEFRSLLGSPEAYNYALFNANILKPAIKEVSKFFEGLKLDVVRHRDGLGRLVPKTLTFKFKKTQHNFNYKDATKASIGINTLVKSLENTKDFDGKDKLINAINSLKKEFKEQGVFNV